MHFRDASPPMRSLDNSSSILLLQFEYYEFQKFKSFVFTCFEKAERAPLIVATITPSPVKVAIAIAGADSVSQDSKVFPRFITPILPSRPTTIICPSPAQRPEAVIATGDQPIACFSIT